MKRGRQAWHSTDGIMMSDFACQVANMIIANRLDRNSKEIAPPPLVALVKNSTYIGMPPQVQDVIDAWVTANMGVLEGIDEAAAATQGLPDGPLTLSAKMVAEPASEAGDLPAFSPTGRVSTSDATAVLQQLGAAVAVANTTEVAPVDTADSARALRNLMLLLHTVFVQWDPNDQAGCKRYDLACQWLADNCRIDGRTLTVGVDLDLRDEPTVTAVTLEIEQIELEEEMEKTAAAYLTEEHLFKHGMTHAGAFIDRLVTVLARQQLEHAAKTTDLDTAVTDLSPAIKLVQEYDLDKNHVYTARGLMVEVIVKSNDDTVTSADTGICAEIPEALLIPVPLVECMEEWFRSNFDLQTVGDALKELQDGLETETLSDEQHCFLLSFRAVIDLMLEEPLNQAAIHVDAASDFLSKHGKKFDNLYKQYTARPHLPKLDYFMLTSGHYPVPFDLSTIAEKVVQERKERLDAIDAANDNKNTAFSHSKLVTANFAASSGDLNSVRVTLPSERAVNRTGRHSDWPLRDKLWRYLKLKTGGQQSTSGAAIMSDEQCTELVLAIIAWSIYADYTDDVVALVWRMCPDAAQRMRSLNRVIVVAITDSVTADTPNAGLLRTLGWLHHISEVQQEFDHTTGARLSNNSQTSPLAVNCLIVDENDNGYAEKVRSWLREVEKANATVTNLGAALNSSQATATAEELATEEVTAAAAEEPTTEQVTAEAEEPTTEQVTAEAEEPTTEQVTTTAAVAPVDTRRGGEAAAAAEEPLPALEVMHILPSVFDGATGNTKKKVVKALKCLINSYLDINGARAEYTGWQLSESCKKELSGALVLYALYTGQDVHDFVKRHYSAFYKAYSGVRITKVNNIEYDSPLSTWKACGWLQRCIEFSEGTGACSVRREKFGSQRYAADATPFVEVCGPGNNEATAEYVTDIKAIVRHYRRKRKQAEEAAGNGALPTLQVVHVTSAAFEQATGHSADSLKTAIGDLINRYTKFVGKDIPVYTGPELSHECQREFLQALVLWARCDGQDAPAFVARAYPPFREVYAGVEVIEVAEVTLNSAEDVLLACSWLHRVIALSRSKASRQGVFQRSASAAKANPFVPRATSQVEVALCTSKIKEVVRKHAKEGNAPATAGAKEGNASATAGAKTGTKAPATAGAKTGTKAPATMVAKERTKGRTPAHLKCATGVTISDDKDDDDADEDKKKNDDSTRSNVPAGTKVKFSLGDITRLAQQLEEKDSAAAPAAAAAPSPARASQQKTKDVNVPAGVVVQSEAEEEAEEDAEEDAAVAEYLRNFKGEWQDFINPDNCPKGIIPNTDDAEDEVIKGTLEWRRAKRKEAAEELLARLQVLFPGLLKKHQYKRSTKRAESKVINEQMHAVARRLYKAAGQKSKQASSEDEKYAWKLKANMHVRMWRGIGSQGRDDHQNDLLKKVKGGNAHSNAMGQLFPPAVLLEMQKMPTNAAGETVISDPLSTKEIQKRTKGLEKAPNNLHADKMRGIDDVLVYGGKEWITYEPHAPLGQPDRTLPPFPKAVSNCGAVVAAALCNIPPELQENPGATLHTGINQLLPDPKLQLVAGYEWRDRKQPGTDATTPEHLRAKTKDELAKASKITRCVVVRFQVGNKDGSYMHFGLVDTWTGEFFIGLCMDENGKLGYYKVNLSPDDFRPCADPVAEKARLRRVHEFFTTPEAQRGPNGQFIRLHDVYYVMTDPRPRAEIVRYKAELARNQAAREKRGQAQARPAYQKKKALRVPAAGDAAPAAKRVCVDDTKNEAPAEQQPPQRPAAAEAKETPRPPAADEVVEVEEEQPPPGPQVQRKRKMEDDPLEQRPSNKAALTARMRTVFGRQEKPHGCGPVQPTTEVAQAQQPGGRVPPAEHGPGDQSPTRKRKAEDDPLEQRPSKKAALTARMRAIPALAARMRAVFGPRPAERPHSLPPAARKRKVSDLGVIEEHPCLKKRCTTPST